MLQNILLEGSEHGESALCNRHLPSLVRRKAKRQVRSQAQHRSIPWKFERERPGTMLSGLRSTKMQGDPMTEAGTKQMGQVVAGKFRLGQFVGESERSSVFLAEYDGQEVQKAAIKLILADSVDAAAQIARWKQAAKLSHPHLIRLLDMGRCELDGKPMLYVVMEYAEENLSAVVKRRPLAPAEARALLGPVVDALAYVHAKGFVHCSLKPANIMADDDLLKISSDGLCRIGESAGSMKPGAYDPPEAAGGRISPAGDVWSLGMTLAEALTQRLPVWERTNQGEAALPSNVPEEFADLVRHCLRRDPQMRWAVADIAARLEGNSPALPREIRPTPQTSFANRRPIGAPLLSGQVTAGLVLAGLVLAGLVLAGLAFVAIIAGPRLFRRHAQNQPAPAVAPRQSRVQSPVQSPIQSKVQPPVQSRPQQAAPPPSPHVAQKSSEKRPSEKSPATSSNPAPLPTPVRSAAPATTSTSGIVPGKVVQQVLPAAPQKARDTIQGKVRISVKVHVDESGRVTQAAFDSPGPSQYFAGLALKAAQLWKFAPAQMGGRNVPSEWVLRFEIDPAAINVYPRETSP
jgi:TonB family protein